MSTDLAGLALVAVLAVALPAAAEDPSDPSGDAGDSAEPELTEEERRMIEESLGADAKEAPPAPRPAPQGGGTTFAQMGANMVQNLVPDISLILDVAPAWFSQDESFQLGAHDPSRTGFNLQQLEMAIESNVDPFFRFNSNLVFAQFGVEVEEAYATTLALPWNLQARAGQFLTRMGRINPTHPHSWHFVDQPLVNGKFFGAEGSRGLGLEASVLLPLPWFTTVFLSATDAAGECCARSFYGGDDRGVDDLGDVLVTSRVEQFYPIDADWGLVWGLGAQAGPNPTGFGNRSYIWATDLYLRYRPVENQDRAFVTLTLEAMLREREVPADLLRDVGGYAQLVWRIDQRWETGVRWELVSGTEDDYLDPQWTGSVSRASAQLTFYPSHFSRLRLQAARTDADFREAPVWAGFFALEVVAGAHGAHGF